MGHVPHLVVASPWESEEIELSSMQWRHLSKVLRMGRGDAVTYTDGLGRLGTGSLTSQAIRRGEETEVRRPSELTVAVAPPMSKDRQRFVVEKLAELGVVRLRWLATAHGEGRMASSSKVLAWALAATEQSRGAWLMETPGDVVEFSDLEPPVLICHPGGELDPVPAKTVVIGPEGGFAPEEIPEDARLWDLGPTILRVETAAVVAAARIISD